MQINPYALSGTSAQTPRRNIAAMLILSSMVLVILSPLFLVVLTPLIALYLDKAAEYDAKTFCARIAIGSDITFPVDQAEKQGDWRHYWSDDKMRHTFWFPGFVMDKAYCDVNVDKAGHVTSKHAEMLYD
jgi:hypothetical protein